MSGRRAGDFTTIKPWPRRRGRELLRTPVFAVRTHSAASPLTGQDHQFYLFELPDWVNVIALPDPDHLLMVQQYRHGTAEITLEIPGGVIDVTDASPAAAAGRELLEETGWEAEHVEQIGETAPNPALQSNRCFTCVATNLRDTGRVRLDSSEDIELLKVPLLELPKLLASGAISHSLVVVALCWYLGLRPHGGGGRE